MDDHGNDHGAFKTHVVQEYVTEGKWQEGMNDLLQQISAESSRRVAEIEREDLQVHSLNDALHKSQELFSDKLGDLEKFVHTMRNDLVARDDDLMSNVSVDRIALQKMETTIAHVESEFQKIIEKVRVDVVTQKESVDKSIDLHIMELRERVAGCYDFFNNLMQQTDDDNSEKLRRITEDVRRLQGGLSSEANVRMLDVENVFGRLQMLKEELGAQVESEKRQRVLNEEKLTTDQSQLRRLLNTERASAAMNTSIVAGAALTASTLGVSGAAQQDLQTGVSRMLDPAAMTGYNVNAGSNRCSPKTQSRGMFEGSTLLPSADSTLMGGNSSFLNSSPGRWSPSKYLKS